MGLFRSYVQEKILTSARYKGAWTLSIKFPLLYQASNFVVVASLIIGRIFISHLLQLFSMWLTCIQRCWNGPDALKILYKMFLKRCFQYKTRSNQETKKYKKYLENVEFYCIWSIGIYTWLKIYWNYLIVIKKNQQR